ncbi:MAG TPA: oligosaccharide flippase family protein [Bacteroidales bacterium]|nr:oligosaccharide flippase family protein [Bacteroidales bacterium]
MRKKFLTNLGLLLFLNLLVKPFWILGIDRSVQNEVGVSEYGFYFAILNLSFIFNILLDFGITNFNIRSIAQNHQLLNKHFSRIVVLKFILAAVYFAVTLSAGLMLGYSGRQMELLLLLGFNQFILSFILYFRSNISGLLLFRTDSMLSVLDRVLMILFCGALLWGNIVKEPFRIEWFVYTQTAAYLLTALIAAAVVVAKASFKKLYWNKAFVLMILRKSLPFAVLILLMTFYNRIDSVMIEWLLQEPLGNKQAGIYAAAFRLLDASNMIAYLFAVLLLPLFANMIKKQERIEELLRLAFTLLIVISVIAASTAFFYSREVMLLLYPIHADESMYQYIERIDQSAFVFKILMCGFIPISTTYVFGTLLTANGNLRQLNMMAAGGMALNLAMNFWLIPDYFASGAAITSLTTQTVTAIMQVLLARWIFRLKIDWLLMLRLLLWFGGALLIGWLTTQTGLNWVQSFVIMVCALLAYAVILRLFNIRAMIKIIRDVDKV